MKKTRIYQIKRDQKKSLYFREICMLIQKLSFDVPVLQKVYVSRIDLSKDTGICAVYFASYTTPDEFEKALEVLKLYKKSLRSALAKLIHTRYVPDLRFYYDETVEKERHIHSILDKVKDEIDESEHKDEQHADDEDDEDSTQE